MAAAAASLRFRRHGGGRLALGGTADERLVARVRAGDDTAFEAIYDRYHAGLLTFCRHMVGSREEAEDVLQHTFVSAYRALRSGDDDIRLRPWLYAIARNRALSALRARHDDLDVDEVQPAGPELDGLAGHVQRRSELRDLVDDMRRLPDDQRAALVLFELGDQSHDEIAEVLGVRRDKVKALVFQAREGLVRARYARDTPCEEIREQLAVLTRSVPRRSTLHRHLDRCPGCSEFAEAVRGQRSAFQAILPVAPTIGLKAAVLGSALGGGGAAAVGAGVGVGGAAVATGAGVGAGAGGGAAVATGAGVGAGAAGSVSAAGSIASGIAVVGAGASSVHGGLVGLGGKATVAKLLTTLAVTGGGGAHATVGDGPAATIPVPPAIHQAAQPATPYSPAPVVPAPSTAPASPSPAPPVATPTTGSVPVADPVPATVPVSPPASGLANVVAPTPDAAPTTTTDPVPGAAVDPAAPVDAPTAPAAPADPSPTVPADAGATGAGTPPAADPAPATPPTAEPEPVPTTASGGAAPTAPTPDPATAPAPAP